MLAGLLTLFVAVLVVRALPKHIVDENWDKVMINSFAISMFAAVVLQRLLELTLVFGHCMAGYFKSKADTAFVALRWL
jgi:hypothetical protein